MMSKLAKPHNGARFIGGYSRLLASEKFLRFDGVLTGNICVGDDGTFHLEPPYSFDGDC